MIGISKFVAGASACILLAATPFPASASDTDGPVISVAGQDFHSWSEYAASDLFRDHGLRCGTPSREVRDSLYGPGGPIDCSSGQTNPDPAYDPGEVKVINVVVHILMNDACDNGVISDELVFSQIDILNEDFRALTGTNGENGTNSEIHFQLATTDPDGAPTTGITRSCNTAWFNDTGSYWNDLAWDPNRYMNIYTNTAGGALGYVPFLPANGGGSLVGTPQDRVVLLWSAVGRDAPFGPPYNQGRTGTHEVGHYLGLEHTFASSGSCPTAATPQCYSNGDLICDTNVESSPTFGCPANSMKCGSPDPIDNYMDYTDDLCMEMFTLEQSRRARCTLEFYRDELSSVSVLEYQDGFED